MSNYRGFGGDDLPDPRKLLEPLKRNLRIVLIAVILVVLAIGAMGSFFQVEPEEEAISIQCKERSHYSQGVLSSGQITVTAKYSIGFASLVTAKYSESSVPEEATAP